MNPTNKGIKMTNVLMAFAFILTFTGCAGYLCYLFIKHFEH